MPSSSKESHKSSPNRSVAIALRCDLHRGSRAHRAKYSYPGVGNIASPGIRALPSGAAISVRKIRRRMASSSRLRGAGSRLCVPRDQSRSRGHRGESTKAITAVSSPRVASPIRFASVAQAVPSSPPSATRLKINARDAAPTIARSRKFSPTSIPINGPASGPMNGPIAGWADCSTIGPSAASRRWTPWTTDRASGTPAGRRSPA